MTQSEINTVLERASMWPQEAQEQLLHSAIDIEKKYVGVYTLSADERADIKEGLNEIRRNEVATDTDVQSTFAHLHSL